ncbi:MAG: hypothetical protein KGI27_12880 [Thaumarchaeota archaeon]|nr:hypothetical protein [Nitrososphaerota archaeon]
MKDNPDSRFLKEELVRLIKQSGDDNGLDVAWIPRIDSSKEGEVVGKTIFVYSQDPVQAIETLRHEFVDYLVCKAMKPYQDMVNALLSVLSEKTYRKKEEVVESILKMLECPLSHKNLAVL